MIGGAGPFDSFVLSLSKDELAQDMLQPCDPIQLCRIATLKGVNSTGRRNTSMMRCCNAETETEKVRPGGSACDAFAWSAAGNGACGAATVLEGDRAGAVE